MKKVNFVVAFVLVISCCFGQTPVKKYYCEARLPPMGVGLCGNEVTPPETLCSEHGAALSSLKEKEVSANFRNRFLVIGKQKSQKK